MTNMEKVVEILRQAAEAVRESNLSKEVEAVAFGKAVDLIASVPATTSGARGLRQSQASDVADAPLQRIATKLGVDRELIDETFEVDNGNVNLTVARAKLEAQKSKGTKQIALLVAAARQAAGIEDSTQSRTIRAVAEEYGKLDGPNFAAAINELGDFFSFSGSGGSRRIKMRRAGFEEAAALINRLQG